MFDEALGVRVVLGPEVNKLPEMVGPEDGPVPREVVEVVHDDGNEEVEHKEGANHEEADEEGIGHVGAAALRLASVIRHWVTNSPLTEIDNVEDYRYCYCHLKSIPHPGMQSSMISCQASPVADLNRTSMAMGKDWKLLLRWMFVMYVHNIAMSSPPKKTLYNIQNIPKSAPAKIKKQ